MTLKAGKIVKEAKVLAQGDELFIRFSDGEVQVKVKTNPKIEINYAEENRNI